MFEVSACSVDLLGRGISYGGMPKSLNRYECYIDQTAVDSMSKILLRRWYAD